MIEKYRNGKLAVRETIVENRNLIVENFNNNSALSSIEEYLFDAASKRFMMQKETIYRADGTVERISEYDVNNNSSIKKFTLFNPDGKIVMDYDYVGKIIEYISPINESKRFKVIVDPADSKGCRIGCSPEELESNLLKVVMDDIFSERLSFLNRQTSLHVFLANGYILANARDADKIYCLYGFGKEECNSLEDLQKVLFSPENTSEFKSVIISNLENDHSLCVIVPNPYLEKNRGKKGIIMDSAASEDKFETVALPNGKVERRYLDLPDGLVADIIIGNSLSDQKNGCCTYMAMEGILTTSGMDLKNIRVSILPTSRKTENTKVKFIFKDDGTAVKGKYYSKPVYPTKLESEIVANLNERFEDSIERYKMVRGDDGKLKKCSAFSCYRQISTLLESYDPEKMEMRADSFDQKHFDVADREYAAEFYAWGTRYTNGEFESKDHNRSRFVKRKMDELGLDTSAKNPMRRKNCWQKKKALLVRSRTEHVDTMFIRIW